MASEGLHERFEDHQSETIDRDRAFTALIEELEAADWYDRVRVVVMNVVRLPAVRGAAWHPAEATGCDRAFVGTAGGR